jgi:dUTP pyrophosphatase
MDGAIIHTEPAPLVLKVKRLTPTARLPAKAFPQDAGLDLFADEDVSSENSQAVAVRTGIAVGIPVGWYGQIQGRSSMAARSIDVMGGVIDSGFCGEIVVILSCPAYGVNVARGDRIAQVLLLPVPDVEVVEVEELSQSSRGVSGLGSTGR